MVVNTSDDFRKLTNLMKATRKKRQHWIQTAYPSLTEILKTYSKFIHFDVLVGLKFNLISFKFNF